VAHSKTAPMVRRKRKSAAGSDAAHRLKLRTLKRVKDRVYCLVSIPVNSNAAISLQCTE